MLLICTPDMPEALATELDRQGWLWKHFATPDHAADVTPPDGWQLAVVEAHTPSSAESLRNAVRSLGCGPVILAVPIDSLESHVFDTADWDDFVCLPGHPVELSIRIRRILQDRSPTDDGTLQVGPLALDLRSYQVSLEGRRLDLTYMEYELLKHLAANVGIVLTREELLRDVWGYEYFGGGRTVDVHVRRLRAKFGHEHAHLIGTVRSVGYSFGMLQRD